MCHNPQSRVCFRSFCLLMCGILTLLAVSSCHGQKNPGETESPGSGTSEPTAQQMLICNGASDYVIAADFSDETAKEYAKSLQLKFYTRYRVMLPLRDAGTESAAKSIRIGQSGSAESSALSANMQSSDFACRVTDQGTLFLLATDSGMYLKLDIWLDDVLFSGTAGTDLALPAPTEFVFSRDCADGVFGSAAELLKNGKSDYVLVYESNGTGTRTAATAAAKYIESVCGIRFTVKSDNSVNEREILFGTPARDASATVREKLNSSGGYGICVEGNSVVLCGFDLKGLALATVRFANLLAQTSGNLTLYSSDNRITGYETYPYEQDLDAAVSLYHDMYGTYDSYIAMRYDTLSERDRADQLLTEALIARLGESVVLRYGSSTALRNGFYVKLDPADYSRTAQVKNGGLWVPAAFFRLVFGTEPVTDANGYADLKAFCQENSSWTLFQDTVRGIAVLTHAQTMPFNDLTGSDGFYTNLHYLDKMQDLFTNPVRRDPGNETEQTRVVVAESLYDPSGVWDYTRNPYRTNYSPGICAVNENGKNVLYVSYESCMVENFKTETENETFLRRSTDEGTTWETVGSVKDMRWACIFEVNGCIYLLGTHVETSFAMVAKYDPGTAEFTSANLGKIGGRGAPCSVLIANGRIYKADGNRIMSAGTDADLLSASAWQSSTQWADQLLPESWFLKASGESRCNGYALGEGSVVMGPDGEIYMILRIESQPACGYAAIVRVSEDGTTLSVVESCNSLLRLPTTVSKFSVRYDASTGLYLSMTSLPTLEDLTHGQRNVLALIASRDLIHWEIIDTLLVDREIMNPTLSAAAHAFQYVDFVPCGEHLYLIVREATGYTNTYHDGKYISFYIVRNYTGLIRKNCPELLNR